MVKSVTVSTVVQFQTYSFHFIQKRMLIKLKERQLDQFNFHVNEYIMIQKHYFEYRGESTFIDHAIIDL